MQMNPGTRLGPYEIVAPLGAGGMGEVYRARDTRLGRDVAIKVLPQHLSEQPEVRARFEREARTVSSLNHPNICTLYDVGREGHTDYLVMELVEGETLAEQLSRDSVPLDETLRIGGQIADALDRAHRAGVVHRDLKPGNVMLTKSGAKLMDFGLARATGLAGEKGSGVTVAELTQSPTVAQPLTAEGSIVGTFQYMSPEQLEGKEADARSDIWALGCVLYEMSTGTRAFDGKSQASLISSIMSSHPRPVSESAPMSPPQFDQVVRACIAKDPDDRIQTAHDVKLQLSWIAEGGSKAGVPKPVARRRRNRERLAWGVSAVALGVAAVAIAFSMKPKPEAVPIHASIIPPPGVLYSLSTDKPLPLAISPDGTTIAFCGRQGEGPDLLWVRELGSSEARPLAGTEGAEGPFFSPDGRALAFYADTRLKRIDVAGGPVIDLVDDVSPRGGTWNRAGDILFTRGAMSPTFRVSAGGGPVTAVTALDTTEGEATHRYPHFLPDGRHFLYLARRSGAGGGVEPWIMAQELGSSKRTRVVEVASNVMYASGYLLYVRGRILVAQPFDTKSLSVTGAAVPLVDDVRMDERFSRGVFAVSENGILVCMTGNVQTRTQLRWLDRSGKPLGDVGDPADYTYGGVPQISPDGKTAALPIANRDMGNSGVWLVDLASGRRRKLTVDTADHPGVCWLSDGSVAVTTVRGSHGEVTMMSVDGTKAKVLVEGDDFIWPLTAHGNTLIYMPETHGAYDLFSVSITGDGTPHEFIVTPAIEDQAQFSPDGSLVAYASTQTGRREVFVAVFPQPGARWQVSQDGGQEPRWRADGKELFFVDRENYIVSVDVDHSAGSFQTGASRRLFQFHGSGADVRYDVAADGQRFFVTAPLDEDLALPVTVITDWTRKVAGH